MKTVLVSQLQKNPGQQRTTLDVGKLTELAEAIYARGLDVDHPILVTPNDEGSFRIVRGHRRTMAYCISKLVEGVVEMEAGEKSVHQVIEEYITKLATVETVIWDCAECDWEGDEPKKDQEGVQYCPKCGDQAVSQTTNKETDGKQLANAFDGVLEETGDLEIQVLSQNFPTSADEQLTLLTDAFGAEDPDILGQSLAFARALELGVSAGRIAQNTGMRTEEVYGLAMLSGMPQHVQDLAVKGELKVSHLAKIIGINNKVHREAMYLVFKHWRPNHRVIDQAIANMREWEVPSIGLMAMTPHERNTIRMENEAWDLAGETPEYWMAVATSPKNIGPRLKAAGLSNESALLSVLPCLQCKTCQVRDFVTKLPKHLRNYSYKCSSNGDDGWCTLAVAEGDPWLVEVRPNAGFPSTIEINGTTFANKPEMPEDVEEIADEPEEVDSPLERQRADIGKFLQINGTLKGAAHPWATRCESCAYHLESSPTKNPNVPHCLWARNRRSVSVQILQPEDGRDYMIPVCRQYQPTSEWGQMIPETKVDGSFTRQQAERLVIRIGKLLLSERKPVLRHLTGQPIKSDEDVEPLFLQQFEKKKADLSDGQIVTLAKWMLAEWQGSIQSEIPLELPTGLEINFRPVGVSNVG